MERSLHGAAVGNLPPFCEFCRYKIILFPEETLRDHILQSEEPFQGHITEEYNLQRIAAESRNTAA